MTIFAVTATGPFPGLHVVRVWMIWMVVPIPNANGNTGSNFKRPAAVDVFARSAILHGFVDLFWYMG